MYKWNLFKISDLCSFFNFDFIFFKYLEDLTNYKVFNFIYLDFIYIKN